MRNFIVVIFVVIIVIIAAIWFYSGQNPHAQQARTQITGAATETKQFLEEKLGLTNLSAQEIKDEMSKAGHVIREKTGEAVHTASDATADARITAAIKAKYVKDPNLSALNISVSTTNGKVTLSGTASSPENIKRAMQLAMETDGVREVTSTLQVKS